MSSSAGFFAQPASANATVNATAKLAMRRLWEKDMGELLQ
jgi:hypothetical protein